MKIPPNYSISPEIIELITKIEANRINFLEFKIPEQIKENIQRISLLKSSLYSARIEGNPLEMRDINFEKDDQKDKKEVFNILDGSRFIETRVKKNKVTKEIILSLHKLALKEIDDSAGYFRTEQNAIFNQAGVAVYVPPAPISIPKLIDELLIFVNSDKERFPLITAFIAHLIFEKIHPFIDGNGRVGRLLISLILKTKGWDFTFTIPFEEYLDEFKSDYYYHLDQGLIKTDDYLVFMLTAFLKEIEKVKKQIEVDSSTKNKIFLPPRQEEIYNIIKEHSIVSFNMIKRRFLKVPERTLRYDLKKLFDKKIIEKTGGTKGSYYRILE